MTGEFHFCRRAQSQSGAAEHSQFPNIAVRVITT
uniref:Uncharacterized protein n=1 Tax=Anguilla anguilla TaxID=7936 RepID=A0A0E9R5I9_ANGAN